MPQHVRDVLYRLENQRGGLTHSATLPDGAKYWKITSQWPFKTHTETLIDIPVEKVNDWVQQFLQNFDRR